MAKSFAVTTTATDSWKADAQGHAEALFTVTNTTPRPIRGLARAKPLGDTKQQWLSIAGDTERDFAAGATQQFTVSFDAADGAQPTPGARPASATPSGGGAGGGVPAGKYPFRLDVASAQNPDEDFTEGPTVNVEVAAAAQPAKKSFPLWIIFVILGIVLVIGVVILILVLSKGGGKPNNNGATPTPTATPSNESRCFDLVQGHISWDHVGNKTWDAVNVRNLCRGTSNPTEPPRCFDRVMHGLYYNDVFAGGTRWESIFAVELCAGTNNADSTISCFQARTAAGVKWQQAINDCKSR